MLDCQKDKFSIPEGTHYLNCAYMSPMMKSVEEAGQLSIAKKRNPSVITAEDFFTESDELRQEFATLINLNDPNQVAIIPSVSYGIGNAANNIPLSSQDEIILIGEQFPSNVYVWMEKAKQTGARIVTIAAPEESEGRAKRWNEAILEAITSKTKVVAMAIVHWTDGTLFNLEAISQRVKEVDGYLIIDGTQSVGALPFDVNKIQPDALICAGYKWLLGPYGIGIGYYSERFNDGNPIEYHWITRLHSEDFAGLVNYESQYQPGATRYDMGERSNFILVSMQLAALRQINAWGVNQVQDYCNSIVGDQLDPLLDAGFSVESDQWRGHHLFGIRFDKKHDPKNIADMLDKKNVRVSVRGSAVRVAPYVFNSATDIEVLVKVLTQSIL